jgi:hypothetical protein
VPRRIEVPSADALFGGPAAPRPAPAPDAVPVAASTARGAEVEVRTPAPRPRRARRAATPIRTDQGTLRRIEELETGLAELPVDRLIELREELEALLAAGSVDADRLERVLRLTGR